MLRLDLRARLGDRPVAVHNCTLGAHLAERPHFCMTTVHN